VVRPGRGAWRFRRGLALAAGCTLLSGAAHVVGGGHAPDPGALLVVALLTVAGCVAWADRRRDPAEIVAVVLLSQPLLHLAMAAGHSPAGGAAPALPEARMVVAHALAAVLLGILLAGAEALIWSRAAAAALRPVPWRLLAALLGGRAPAPVRRAGVHPAALAVAPSSADVAQRPARRGPPHAAA
jgi:hypothetical protein